MGVTSLSLFLGSVVSNGVYTSWAALIEVPPSSVPAL